MQLTGKVLVISLPEAIKLKLKFPANALRREVRSEVDQGHSLKMSIFTFR